MRKKPFDYRKKKILLRKFREEYQDELELKNTAEKMKVDTSHVVVVKKSTATRALEIFMDVLYRVVKSIIWIMLCIIFTLGVNCIINPTLRTQIFNSITALFK